MRNKESDSTTLGFSDSLADTNVRAEEKVVIPTLTIIYHPNLDRIGERLVMSELPAGRQIAINRVQPAFSRGDQLGKPLDDPFISRAPFTFIPDVSGAVILEVGNCRTRLMIDGSAEQKTRCFERDQLLHGVVLELAERVVLLLSLRLPIWEQKPASYGLIGDGPALLRVKQAIGLVSDLNMPVLLRGESGTGKELVASAIHHSGPRCNGPFVSVNLGALTPSLAASELFGSAKGAFTGALQSRQGLFRRAHGGTLFLDEIGEAPSDIQVMLLRALETGEIRPVGADRSQPVDVRIIAATDANLDVMAQSKTFRLPLLHRLAGYELHLPPLHERREDMGLLLRYFLRAELAAVGEQQRLLLSRPNQTPWFPASLVRLMCAYSWPGNIREFRNVLRQLVIASRGGDGLVIDKVIADKLATRDLNPSSAAGSVSIAETRRSRRRKPSSIGEQELIEALALERWDLEAASKQLNVARSSLYPLIRKSSQLRTAADLDSEEIITCYHQNAGDVTAMVDYLRVSGKALQRRIYELGLQRRALPPSEE